MDVKLVMFKSNGQRKDFSLSQAATIIGRGEKCDLRIPVVSVSRRHCQLTLDTEEVSIKDLASSNGTYVNNQRVTESPLAAGDRLVIGPIVFTVQIDGQPEQIQPVKTRGQKLAESGTIDESEDLEAEVISQPHASEEIDPVAAGLSAEMDDEDEDPIAALEALAAEMQDEEDEDGPV